MLMQTPRIRQRQITPPREEAIVLKFDVDASM